MPATDPTSTMPPSASAMLAALSAERGASVTELAKRAGLGRSTAARVLTMLEGVGLARRERPDRSADHGSPDLWFTAPTEQATPDTSHEALADRTPEAGPDTLSSNVPPTTHTDDPQPAHDGDQEHDAESADAPDCDSAEEPAALQTVTEPEDTPDGEVAITPKDPGDRPNPELADKDLVATVATAPTPGQQSDACAADGQPDPDTVAAPDPATESGTAGTANADGEPDTTGATRLGKGELRALVFEHLKAHPDEEFTASQVGKALNKSSGAVSNNFDTLVKTGDAQMTCEKPRRFRFLAKAAS